MTLLTSRTLLDRDTSAFTALVIETVSSKALSVLIVPELTGFYLSDDIVNAAWNAGLGVHALIWVRPFQMEMAVVILTVFGHIVWIRWN